MIKHDFSLSLDLDLVYLFSRAANLDYLNLDLDYFWMI